MNEIDPLSGGASGHKCGCGHHGASGQAAPAGEPPAPKEGGGCGCQSLAPWRRLHGLCGAGFGLFALFHLGVVSLGMQPSRYQLLASALETLKGQVAPFRWLLWGLPVLLAATGLYLLFRAGLAYGVKRCKRGGKAPYALQRWSALALLGFLSFHLFQSLRTFVPARALESTHLMVAATPLRAALTVLGLGALAFHAANGLSTAWIFWKLPGGEEPKGWRTLLVTAAALVFASLGAAACWAFVV